MAAPEYTKDALKPFVDRGIAIIGDHSYGAPMLRYAGQGYKFICGKYCSIADRVQIFMGGYHRPDWVSMYPFPAFPHWPEAQGIKDFAVGKGDVVVGHDVWLGSHSTIMSGVRIGNGAVVSAQASVAADVPAYAIVAGNPGRVVKYRFEEHIIKALEDIAWWHWPEDKVRQYIPQLLSGDIYGFVAQHRTTFPV